MLVRATVVSNTELHINTTVARIPWPVRTALDMNGGGRFHLSVGRSGEKGKTAPNSWGIQSFGRSEGHFTSIWNPLCIYHGSVLSLYVLLMVTLL